MEQNSTDVIIKTENVINAVQNEPSTWNSELNSVGPDQNCWRTSVFKKLAYFYFLEDLLALWTFGT